MARLGTRRVTDVLDYERDIKGKGLVRLRAGVGAGKNYWVRHLPESHPKLQILMVTSRKNTAAAEAYYLGIDNKIHTGELIDIQDKEWCKNYSGNLMVCTNAYIEHFFKNIYDSENEQTHLWNKFDVIFVDEVHSLTADAAFADSPFYVGRFIYHTRLLNPACDVVLMSGTPEATDWFFDDVFLSSEYTTIDLYDKCIHLVPDEVSLVSKEAVPVYMQRLYQLGARQIYFVNSVGRMAALVDTLMSLAVPESAIGIAYTESENAQKLPEGLVRNKEAIRKSLVEHAKLPDEIKIFITTTQNKEGISIVDDDIKIMFSESHQKAELEQMAGRVRGNPNTGTGISVLLLVYDAAPHPTFSTYVEKELDKVLVGNIECVVEQHKQLLESKGKEYSLGNDIMSIHEHHHYIRYDYIGKEFCFYAAREQQGLQSKDRATLATYAALYDQTLYYYINAYGDDHSMHAATGLTELREKWFPYSKVYMILSKEGILEEIRLGSIAAALRSQLEEKKFLGVRLDEAKKKEVYDIVYRLVDQYGTSALGLRNSRPKNLGRLFRRLNLTWGTVDHHSNDKIIHVLEPVDGDAPEASM